MRPGGRNPQSIREITFTRGVNKYAEGSCLVSMGQTRVLCLVTVEEKVPQFLKEKNEGWLTSEYRMLPRATENRVTREKISGRVYEIQRFIGRSLRSIFNTKAVPGKTFIVDCDVLQADGGTRTASVNGSFVALADAVLQVYKQKKIASIPITNYLGAVSVGVVDGEVLADLSYEEDAQAEIDMNVVMTGAKQFIELQGTAERRSFDRSMLTTMLDHAESGIQQIIAAQREIYKDIFHF